MLCYFFQILSSVREEEQNMPPQNMFLWHKGDLELVIFKKLQTQEKLGKPRSGSLQGTLTFYEANHS